MEARVILMSRHRTRRSRCGVTGCTRPAPAGVLCTEHVEDVCDALGDLPALAHALDSRYLRLQRFSVVSLSEQKPDESALPYDDRAGRLRRELSRFLLHWVMEIDAPGSARSTVESESAYLLRAVTHRRSNPSVSKMADELLSLHPRIAEAVDRPPDLVYLGVCSWQTDRGECPADLYAEWAAPFAKCRVCKHEHSVAARRDVLLAALDDQLATASDIARGLSGLGIGVTAERIRKWKNRKRIAERGTDYRGNPLYRVGDVIDLIYGERREQAEA